MGYRSYVTWFIIEHDSTRYRAMFSSDVTTQLHQVVYENELGS